MNNIHVYDDLFSFEERTRFYRFITRSFYKINGFDTDTSSSHNQIFASFNNDDLNKFGICNTEAFKKLDIIHSLSKRSIKQIRVNCSTPTEECNFHTDEIKGGVTFLYYVNLNWRPEWLGYTIFGSDNLKEVIHTSFYVPGRVIIFDGSIPHMVIPPSVYARGHRLTFAIQYTPLP